MSDKIAFEVETSRVLELLSKEIYDSPLALLRENVQNAYDATLMRCTHEGTDIREAEVRITIGPDHLVIEDDGIGMTEEVLRNNFWRAGSSGKHTDLARKSGVIGTFGIGAMANFGVCSKLCVETRSVESDTTLFSVAEKAKLSFSQECIELNRVKDERKPGTKLTVDLDLDSRIDERQAAAYLESYVTYLPVKVLLNGKAVSQKDYREMVYKGFSPLGEKSSFLNGYSALVHVWLDSNGQVLARVTDVKLQGNPANGDLMLGQGAGQLMGLRNYFGLAPVPVGGYYQFGGFANLSILQPTAGREALSRESIVHVNNLVALSENVVTELIANTEAADKNNAFLQHILNDSRLDLASRVTITVQPDDVAVPFGQLVDYCKGKKSLYYTGNDGSIIRTFSGPDIRLLVISQSNPRRKLQLRYIQKKLGVQEVPDKVAILKVYAANELLREEAAFLARVLATLSDDYLLSDVTVEFADISHSVPIKIEKQSNTLRLTLARDGSSVKPVIASYYTAYEVFGGFVKDYVRNHVYPLITKYVPSSTREGVDALARVLLRNRELYRYEENELGDLEPLLGDYLAGEITLARVLSVAKSAGRPSTQIVRKDQVGTLEEAIPDMAVSPEDPQAAVNQKYEAAPSIMREDLVSTLKILRTSNKHAQLNAFEMFLGLSDKMVKREGDFFRYPHTTKIIWAGHRIVYIFTEASGKITLYYDIELREPLEEKAASGGMFPTTTLVLKNRIYVPVPNELESAFRLVDGVKEFYVRFDAITGPDISATSST
jgi:molecular chaperone HtpG